MNKLMNSVLGIILIFGLTAIGEPGEGKLQFVETEVRLLPDGKASVEYVVRYQVVSGEFHGFYFEGFDKLIPYFDNQNASAVDSQGNTYDLDIKKIRTGFYDIVLDKGEAVSSGFITYRFRFSADMLAAGYLAETLTAEGKNLIVFSWSPSSWDQSLEHATVLVIYPINLNSEQTGREDLEAVLLKRGFATEEWMNREYLIDYRSYTVGEKQHVGVLLHKENTPKMYDFRIQQYIDADVFSGITDKPAPVHALPQPLQIVEKRVKKNSSRLILGGGLIVLLLASVFAFSRKHRSMVRAQSELDQVQWIRENWEPPKIELASFRKPGKIAQDLDPIEAGMFIGVPYKQIFSTVLSQLIQRDCLKVVTRDPLVVEVIQ
ncbi:DUF2207 domain-containing protein, partial [Acidobacteriota bacterium]